MNRNKDGRGSMSAWNVKEFDFPKKGKLESKIKFLIRYGILAPSGFNSQPWKFDLGEKQLIVRPDYERKRPMVDPNDREMFISLGCAVKNVEVAAGYFGLIFDKKYLDDQVVFEFKEGEKLSENKEMFGAIVNRATYRGEYKTKKIPKEIIKIISKDDDLEIFADQESKNKLAEIVYGSNKVWYKSKELVEELDYWLTDDLRGREGGIPTGILNLYKIAISFRQFLSKENPEVEIKAQREKGLIEKSPVLLILKSNEDKIADWIKAGEKFEELSLELTTKGISAGFFNTVIQLKTQRKKLEGLIKNKKNAQLLIRIGYPKEIVSKSPRRELKSFYEPTTIH